MGVVDVFAVGLMPAGRCVWAVVTFMGVVRLARCWSRLRLQSMHVVKKLPFRITPVKLGHPALSHRWVLGGLGVVVGEMMFCV